MRARLPAGRCNRDQRPDDRSRPRYRPAPIADSNTGLGQPITEGSVTPVTLDVMANDFTREKDGLTSVHTTIASFTQPPAGQGTVTDTADHKQLIYTPPGGDFFTPDAAHAVVFTYTLTDDSGVAVGQRYQRSSHG